jgi:hypothetical protein
MWFKYHNDKVYAYFAAVLHINYSYCDVGLFKFLGTLKKQLLLSSCLPIHY